MPRLAYARFLSQSPATSKERDQGPEAAFPDASIPDAAVSAALPTALPHTLQHWQSRFECSVECCRLEMPQLFFATSLQKTSVMSYSLSHLIQMRMSVFQPQSHAEFWGVDEASRTCAALWAHASACCSRGPCARGLASRLSYVCPITRVPSSMQYSP